MLYQTENSRGFKHTVNKVTRIYHPGTNAHEKNTILGILRAEFGHGSVQARLADGVEGGDFDSQLGNDVESSLTTGDGDNLLDLALKNQGREKVEQVNIANDVDFETLGQVLLQGFGLLSPVGINFALLVTVSSQS